MCETLAGLKQAGAAFAARFDVALVPPGQLGQVLLDAGTLEKMFAHIAAACAARMAGRGGSSVREAVTGLARASGTSLAEAAKALEAAKQIEAQPDVAQAVRAGELSRQQAGLVAGAVANNPGSAPQLLEMARRSSMRELADESLRAWEVLAKAVKLVARRCTPPGSSAITPAQTVRSTCTPVAPPNKVPWLWQPCAPSQTNYSNLPGKKDVVKNRRLIPGTPWSNWRLLAPLARAVAGAPRPEVMVRVDHSALLRGYPLDGEVCDIPGFGTTTVEAVRDMIATGDPVLKAIVTEGKKVLGVVHMRRRPNAYQKSALDWMFPTCAANGCSTRACFLETDHREDWARTHVTMLELLDRLCRYHHRLKTTKGWALVEGSGKRDFVPPEDPRHPRHATARSARSARASAISPADAAAIVGEGSWSAMLPARVPAAIEAGPARGPQSPLLLRPD